MTELEIRNVYLEHLHGQWGNKDPNSTIVAAILTLARVISQVQPVSAVLEQSRFTDYPFATESEVENAKRSYESWRNMKTNG